MGKKKNVIVVLGDPNLPDRIKFEGKFGKEDFETIDKLKQALNLLDDYNFFYLDNHSTLINDIKRMKKNTDYVFNLCDEGFENEPSKEAFIPEICEVEKIPYTGAASRCLHLRERKSDIKAIAKQEGIPVADGILIRRLTDEKAKIDAENFGWPRFVKPDCSDGSFGISKESLVYNSDELLEQINKKRQSLRKAGCREDLLVEEYLPGVEITAAIIGNRKEPEIKLLEEDFSCLSKGRKPFITYDSKWNPGSEDWKITSKAPSIPKSIQEEIEKYSSRLFDIIECRDYARFDWRLDEFKKPKFLEANPNCGWCWDSHLVKAFSFGRENEDAREVYASILHKILMAAEKQFAG